MMGKALLMFGWLRSMALSMKGAILRAAAIGICVSVWVAMPSESRAQSYCMTGPGIVTRTEPGRPIDPAMLLRRVAGPHVFDIPWSYLRPSADKPNCQKDPWEFWFRFWMPDLKGLSPETSGTTEVTGSALFRPREKGRIPNKVDEFTVDLSFEYIGDDRPDHDIQVSEGNQNLLSTFKKKSDNPEFGNFIALDAKAMNMWIASNVKYDAYIRCFVHKPQDVVQVCQVYVNYKDLQSNVVAFFPGQMVSSAPAIIEGIHELVVRWKK